MSSNWLQALTGWGVLAALAAGAAPARAQDQDYERDLDAWRADREARLTAADGWLTVAGLFFLREGDNTFGASPLNDIILRTGPEMAGVFTVRNGAITVRATAGTRLDVDGRDVEAAELWPYEGRNRPAVSIGPLTLIGHYSGDRLAIRMRDRESEIRRNFTGLRWFPADDAYRVPGRFAPHDTPLTLELPNILGDVETFRSRGAVTFTVAGRELTMTAVDSGGRLWFIFRDLTSGRDTYPAARFLYAPAPENGWTTVDFNQAYNPPCAFNPHTTCPLPPLENRLPVRIEAGELDYHEPG